MRKLREILRLKLELGRSHREVHDSLKVSVGVISGVVGRAEEAGLDWAAIAELDEKTLAERIYGAPAGSTDDRPCPNMFWIHQERSRPGVTLELLHLEYLETHPNGYRYTAFCNRYRAFLKKRKLSMRQIHKAGDKLFLDYSGKRPCVKDPATGELTPVEMFVAVLGASNFTYVEATETQKSPDWIASHVRALEYLGGVPAALVPDQLKSAVTTSCRYEPGLNRTYEELGIHYGSAILPARPRKPKDKSKVEVGVQIAQRWILARLRNETFFSLGSLNLRIAELLEDLNNRPMKGKGGVSRRELFERLDRPELRPLPAQPFVFADWRIATVNIDYHVEVEGHYYSVPHTFSGSRVEARYTAATVEVLYRHDRIAVHARSNQLGGHTTVAAHMPKAHQAHLEWSPTRLIEWAETIGPNTGKMVQSILHSRRHPEQGYRPCLGILRLTKHYRNERVEAACKRGCLSGSVSYRHIKSILKNSLDRLPLAETNEEPEQVTDSHENVRGAEYYNGALN